MIYNGSSELKAYVGSTEVSKMYLGDTLVYSSGPQPLPNYLCFTALESSTVGISRAGGNTANIEYSLDGSSWAELSETVSLASDDVMYLRGSNTSIGKSTSNYARFTMTGNISVSGNIMSLLYKQGFDSQFALPANMTFYRLFYNCTAMTSASGLKLPATTLKAYCYYQMFYGCSSLEDTPQLPTSYMTHKYTSAFHAMFQNCRRLTEGVKLYATDTWGSCYRSMYNGCSQLSWAMCLAITNTGSNATTDWMKGVASSGIFVKHIDAEWTTTGTAGVPSGWTVIYYNPTTDKYYLSDKATECDDHGNSI